MCVESDVIFVGIGIVFVDDFDFICWLFGFEGWLFVWLVFDWFLFLLLGLKLVWMVYKVFVIVVIFIDMMVCDEVWFVCCVVL